MSRIAPGILAEVTVIVADDGQVGVFMSKVPPEVNGDALCGNVVNALLMYLSTLGRTIDLQMEDGTVVPLVRPRATKD
ncbi:MAG TPA: hypothetical protein VJZ25_00320 [Gemmatimonadaceae bacterium]|nr:hypothetical protein [Gemmatimonadaceae bacterium]